MLLPGLRI